MRRVSLLLIFIIGILFRVLGQDEFVVFGKFKLEKGSLDGQIELLKNGNRETIKQVSGSGKFDFKLDMNAQYVLSFSQQGYVTKKIAISTAVPQERISYGFAPFEFQVTLFKQYEGVNTVVFNQPVAQIMFSSEADDFDYDTDYTKSIQQRIAEVEKEVAEKMKEEEELEKEKPKQKDPPVEKAPEIQASTTVRKEEPPTTPQRRTKPPSPPAKPPYTNLVVLHSYTVGEMGYPNLNAYGFINFGDGTGRREITKEQFNEYAKQYR